MNSFKIENIKDYQNFCNLSLKDKEKILKKIKNILKINEYRRFSYEKKKLTYLSNLMTYLDNDCVKQNLNYKKEETFRIVNRLRYFNSLYIDINALENYFNKYFTNKKDYCYDDLNILFQETFIYLSQYFNLPFESIYFCKDNNFKTCYMNQKIYLEIPQRIENNASSNYLSEDKFIKLAVKQTWSLAHEFAHTAINKYIERKSNENIFFKEVVVSFFDLNFYNENHNNFYSERKANEFALNFIKYLLNDFFDSEKVASEIKKLRQKIDKDKTLITEDDIVKKYERITREKGYENSVAYVKKIFKKETPKSN